LSSKGIVALLVGVCLSFLLALRIDASYHSDGGHFSGDMPVVMRILGESRGIVSSLAFLQADIYFHRGIMGHDDGAEECTFTDLMGKPHDRDVDVHEHDDHTEEAHAVPTDPLLRISGKLLIDSHSHMGTEEIKEIMPWLYYAQKLDPNNVMAYTVTSYYLARRLGKTSEAIALLRQGMVHNPDSWEICAEMGMVMYQNLKDIPAAIRFFKRAALLLERTPHNKFDERHVLTLLANAYAESGQTIKALEILEEVKILFPDSRSLANNISRLENMLSPEERKNEGTQVHSDRGYLSGKNI
jgi:hypothetical protein